MKKLLKPVILLLLLGQFIFPLRAQNIPYDFFGINLWMPDKIGNVTNNYACPGLYQTPPESFNGYSGDFYTTSVKTKVKDMELRFIRFGGSAPDLQEPTYDQYLKAIDEIRSLGAEPIIQVPFFNNNFSTTDATNLITYLNISRSKKIKYWTIGNEWDRYNSTYNTASAIKTNFKAMAKALKDVDQTIQIIGPDLSYYGANPDGLGNIHMVDLIGGAQDITKAISVDFSGYTANIYYLDILSFHTYPYDNSGITTSMLYNSRRAAILVNQSQAFIHQILMQLEQECLPS